MMMKPMLKTIGVSAALLSATPIVLAEGEAEMLAYARSTPQGLEVHAELDGAHGEIFWLMAAPLSDGQTDMGSAQRIAAGVLDLEGSGAVSVTLPQDESWPSAAVSLFAIFRGPTGGTAFGPERILTFGSEGAGDDFCQMLDLDYQPGDGDTLTGQVINDEWALDGINISATNNTVGHPDKAIIFDSGAPTGGDGDLATPGYGPGNDTALGHLLIIAENDHDGGGDGFVDVPDDEMFGGIIRFDFDSPISMCAITILDIDDDAASELRFHKDGGGMDIIPLANMGDNSVQEIFFDQENVIAFEAVFGGSGGIANVVLEPCPMLINLDETPLGIPMGLMTGEEILEQYAFLGLHISGTNNVAGHPDKVILFDTANPTGGDDDLATPGSGIGNDTPLHKVLIIAENDVDSDADGLVDDPDDEGGGGTMNFDFDADITFMEITILDVDGSRQDFVELQDAAHTTLLTIDAVNLGDNSVQTLTPDNPVSGVRHIILHLDGSGATTRLRWCPDTSPAGSK